MILQSQVACGVVIGEGRLRENSNLTLRFFSRWQSLPNDSGIKTVELGGSRVEHCAEEQMLPCSLSGSARASWQPFSILHPFVQSTF